MGMKNCRLTRNSGQQTSSGGRDGGKRMIQRLNEENDRHEKHCTEHMELMQARLTALEPNDRPLTTPKLLVVNCVK